MKLLTFTRTESAAEPKVGAWLDGDIVDLEAALRRAHPEEKLPGSLRSLVAAGQSGIAAARRALDAAASGRAGDAIRLRRHEVRLLPPIPDARPFLCVGKNNKSHLDELMRNQLINEIPKEPTGFIKLSSVMVGDDAAVVRP